MVPAFPEQTRTGFGLVQPPALQMEVRRRTQHDTLMTDNAKTDVLQPVDENARRLAKTLVRSARFASLGVLDPKDGWPMVSRINTATLMDGRPIFLISRLAAHTPALENDPRASLLFGEPGKGDPTAHARMTVTGSATKIMGDSEREHARQRFTARHPKSKLYVDFSDFSFWVLAPMRLALNGGFAQAFAPSPSDMLTDMSGLERLAEMESDAIAHMNTDHRDAVDNYAKRAGSAKTGWRLAGLDPEGVDLARGDDALRVWFDQPIKSADDLRTTLIRLARDDRSLALE